MHPRGGTTNVAQSDDAGRPDSAAPPDAAPDVRVTREQWHKTILAAMANYIDSGSIVAGAVALPLWTKQFGFGSSFVSFLGAFSSNAISAGLGALIGGRICDLLGRKKIYQWDLLLYAFGVLWIVFAQAGWMLLVGYFIVGLTVGADVPASWTLITETAPTRARGRLAGTAQIFWYVGTLVPLMLGIALLGLGDTMPRILFAQLFVVALVTWALRQGIVESVVWTRARDESPRSGRAIRELLQGRHVRALVFLILMYGIWNLVAGTYGFFFPYILDAVGSTTPRATYALQAIWFLSTALAVGGIYMPLVDRVSRRNLLVWSTLLQVVAFIPFIFLHVTFAVALFNVLLFGVGAGIGRAVAVPAVERRALPHPAALQRPGRDVRVRAHRSGRLDPAAADGREGRVQHAGRRPGRPAARVRRHRGRVRSTHPRARPRRDRSGRGAGATSASRQARAGVNRSPDRPGSRSMVMRGTAHAHPRRSPAKAEGAAFARAMNLDPVDSGRQGAIAQLGERLLCKQEVAGSIPAGSTLRSPGNRRFLAC